MAARRRSRRSRLTGVALLTAATLFGLVALSPAVTFDPFSIPGLPIPPAAKKAHGVWKRTQKLNQSYNDCLALGGSAEECAAQAVLCDLQGQAIDRYLSGLGLTAKLIKQLKIFDSFKLACDGKCFWCCLTPMGCHSSFGPSPVINCNLNYGLGSHTIGYTLIVGKAVGACLGIPQTCDSYAQCRLASAKGYPQAGALPPPVDPYTPRPVLDFGYVAPLGPDGGCGLSPGYQPEKDRTSLLASKEPEVNDFVMQQKFRAFTESLSRKVAEFLDSLPADYADGEVLDLLSFRGCKGYSQLKDVEPWNGKADVFKVTARSPEVAAQVAARRALRFVAVMRLLAAVPNLYRRFAAVEAQLWPCAEREAYLRQAGITDPDQELRRHLSPVALRILKTVDVLQDYRLLAVPAPGEEPPAAGARVFDGCELGAPPVLTVTPAAPGGPQAMAAGDYALQVAVADEDLTDGERGLPLPLSIDWGDGAVTEHSYPAGQGGGFSHRYGAAGVYRVVAEAGGVSGLRGATALVVQVEEAGGKGPLPSFHRLTLPRVQVYSESTGDEGSLGVSLELAGAEGEAQAAGRSERAPVKNRQPPMVSGYGDLGDVIAFNEERREATRLILRPQRLGGGTTFRDARKVYLVLPGEVQLDGYSLAQAQPLSRRAALTAEAARAYYNDQPAVAVPLQPVAEAPAGRLRAPLLPMSAPMGRDPARELNRVEIDLRPALSGLDPGRLPLPAEDVGRSARFRELVPNQLSPEAPPMSEGGCACSLPGAGRR